MRLVVAIAPRCAVRTLGGCTQHVLGLTRPPPRGGSWRRVRDEHSRTRPDAVRFPTVRPLQSAGSSRTGRPVCGSSGVGQAPSSHPRRRGGAGVRLSMAPQCHSSSQWPAQPCPLLGPPQGASPLGATPVHSRRRLFTHVLTWFFSSKGSSVFDAGGIGGPSGRLAPRAATANAPLGLTRVTTHCHSHGPPRRCVVARAGAYGSR